MSKTIEQLPVRFKRKGFVYEQVCRNQEKVLYRQSMNGKTIAFELFRIKIQKPTEFNGIILKEKEMFPSDEAFGSWAWSLQFMSEEKAIQRYNDLQPISRI